MQTFNARFLFKDYLLTIEKKLFVCEKGLEWNTSNTKHFENGGPFLG